MTIFCFLLLYPNLAQSRHADCSQTVKESKALLIPFEESLRKRIGRWIQRYPEIEADLGERFDLADMVEEVFLNAFERYEDHPRQVPFGDWLEHLIDPSVKLLVKRTDEELANINFARSAVEAENARNGNSIPRQGH